MENTRSNQMKDLTSILTQTNNTEVINNSGKLLGRLAGTIPKNPQDICEYVILKSEEFFGRGYRFFAVPANSSLIQVNEEGKIIIQLKMDDLQFARGVSADKVPKPNLKYGLSVFELYNYDDENRNPSVSKFRNHKKTNETTKI
jgi:hypothetical protein